MKLYLLKKVPDLLGNSEVSQHSHAPSLPLPPPILEYVRTKAW